MINRLMVYGAAVSLAAALTQQGAFPWRAGDPPPLVGGLHLGATRARMDSVLGSPSDSQHIALDGWAYNFRAKGISVIYAALDGASIIYLTRRDAGDIGGVRLGDPKTAVLARWGQPTTAGGPNSLYVAGKWVVVVTFDSTGSTVARLGVGRTS